MNTTSGSEFNIILVEETTVKPPNLVQKFIALLLGSQPKDSCNDNFIQNISSH